MTTIKNMGINKEDFFTRFVFTKLNIKVVKEYKFHLERKWRFDYCIIEYKIAIEVEGGLHKYGRHNRPDGYINDMEKYNEASLLGYTLIRVTPQQLITLKTINMIQRAIDKYHHSH